MASVIRTACGKTFHVCCDAVHKVLNTVTNHVCDSIPGDFEPARVRTERRRRKRKRTARWRHKLTNYYRLKFTRGRNRRGWNKPWKEPKDRKNHRLQWLINHQTGRPGWFEKWRTNSAKSDNWKEKEPKHRKAEDTPPKRPDSAGTGCKTVELTSDEEESAWYNSYQWRNGSYAFGNNPGEDTDGSVEEKITKIDKTEDEDTGY